MYGKLVKVIILNFGLDNFRSNIWWICIKRSHIDKIISLKKLLDKYQKTKKQLMGWFQKDTLRLYI